MQVLQGAILDVVVDLRKAAPDCGRWMRVELSAECGQQLFVTAGFAHGIVSRKDRPEFLCKCSDQRVEYWEVQVLQRHRLAAEPLLIV